MRFLKVKIVQIVKHFNTTEVIEFWHFTTLNFIQKYITYQYQNVKIQYSKHYCTIARCIFTNFTLFSQKFKRLMNLKF